MKNTLLKQGMIKPEDLDYVYLTDKPKEAAKICEQAYGKFLKNYRKELKAANLI